MRTWGLRVWRIDDPSVDTLDSLPEDSYLGHFMADADAEVRDLRRWVEGSARVPPSRQAYHCISGTNGNFVWKFDPLPVLQRGDDNLRDVLAGYKDEGRSFFIHSIAVRFLSEGKGHVADTSDDDEGGSVEVSSAAGDMSVSVGSSSFSEETPSPSPSSSPSRGKAATTASGGSAGSGEMTTTMMSVASSSEETSSSEATVSDWLSSTVPLLPLSPDDLSVLAAREDGSFDDGSDSAEEIEEAEEIELVDPDDEDEDEDEEEEEEEGLTFVERAHREALMEALSGEG